MPSIARRLVLGLVIAGTLVGAARPSPAAAAQYASAGAIGPSSVGIGACSYMRNMTSGWLQTTTLPPTIYARNNFAGAGNDRQLVRYRAFLVNAATGATVQSTGYSGLAWAWDNSPAAFSGSTILTGDWRGNFVVDYRIEWLNDSGTVVLGWTAQRFDRYNYFNQRVGPYGPIGTCAKIM